MGAWGQGAAVQVGQGAWGQGVSVQVGQLISAAKSD